MRRLKLSAFLVLGIMALGMVASSAQEPKKEGPPPEPGTVIPPFVRSKLKLTEEQQRQVATLEFNMRAKLGKVLSERQMMLFDETLKQGPGAMGKDKKGPPPGKQGGQPLREPMLLIPPFVESRLQLTQDQLKQLVTLEKSAKAELSKLLTDAQRKQFNELLRQGPGEMPGGPNKPKGPPQGKNQPEQNPAPALVGAAAADKAGGIHWFATWQSGRAEAERSGRPILLIAATPHCAGVSGMW